MDDSLWDAFKEYNIQIRVTKYPIDLDYRGITEKAVAYGLDFSFFNDAKVVKLSSNYSFDLKGLCEPRISFYNCANSNNCINLVEGGRLYTCQLAAYIWMFNKRFNQHIEESPEDYISIYEEKDPDKILGFLAKPIPMCRYCDVDSRVCGKWGISKESIGEWIVER
jgi:hypothetical protein